MKGARDLMSCFTDENNKVVCFKDSLASTPCGDIYQAEADYFARCLLMPEDKFRELAEQGYTIDKLSQVFIVPKGQVCARLDELGIDYDAIQANKQNIENIADSASTALVGGGLLALASLLFL